MSVNPPIYNSPSFRELTCLFNVSSFAQGPASVKTRIKKSARSDAFGVHSLSILACESSDFNS